MQDITPLPSSTVEQNVVSGWLCNFNQVEWSKRFAPGEAKMSNMPEAKAESTHQTNLPEEKSLSTPLRNIPVSPLLQLKASHVLLQNHTVAICLNITVQSEYDVFPNVFFLFTPSALNKHECFPIWARSSWPSVPPCEPSVVTGAPTEIDWWLQRRLYDSRKTNIDVFQLIKHFRPLWVTIHFWKCCRRVNTGAE